MSFGSQRSLVSRRTLVIVSLGLLVLLVFSYYHGSDNDIPDTRNPGPAYEKITDKNYQGLWQENPRLITYIRSLLRPPSTEPYQLSNPKRKHFTAMEQSKFVGDLYGPGKREGHLFVEVGALNGETSSSTLYLERELGFNGLLIEPNPANHKQLVSKHRKAYILQAALSPTTSSAELLFTGSGQQGHLAEKETSRTIRVKSFPFYSILSALDVTFIDVLNLDIEGFEFKVLKTIPFDKIKLGIMIVEHLNIPEPKAELVKFMTDLGYAKIHENKLDYIFGDPEYLSKLPGWEPSEYLENIVDFL
ncbi:protein Star-like [Macrobrachium rosenbergii]|uniref:protein Star-like n=1 Tax=Macrobrachium rosenbergii TaxID=79674 RepID=UPI0034D42571